MFDRIPSWWYTLNVNLDSDLIRGNVDTIILKCLGTGELYGLEICNVVKEASGGSFVLKQPTLYSALKRLEKQKLITGYWKDSAIGGRRHYYKLTELGQKSLDDKKVDWLVSKHVIDNLVFDQKLKENQEQEVNEKEPFVHVNEELKHAEVTPVSFPAVEEESRIVVTTHPVEPVETYVATVGEYITVPLTHHLTHTTKPTVVAEAATDEKNPYKLEEYNTPVPASASKPLEPVYGHPALNIVNSRPTQLAIEIPTQVDIKPFVKHASDKRSGKFVMYTKLRTVCSVFVCMVLAIAFACTYMYLKNGYTSSERSFFAIGGIIAGIYLLANIALYTAYPKYKRVLSSRTRDLVCRGTIAVCIAVAAISVNIIAGLTAINASDFLVYWVVPCIIGSAFLIEGIAIWALRKNRFFLT